MRFEKIRSSNVENSTLAPTDILLIALEDKFLKISSTPTIVEENMQGALVNLYSMLKPSPVSLFSNSCDLQTSEVYEKIVY